MRSSAARATVIVAIPLPDGGGWLANALVIVAASHPIIPEMSYSERGCALALMAFLVGCESPQALSRSGRSTAVMMIGRWTTIGSSETGSITTASPPVRAQHRAHRMVPPQGLGTPYGS